MIDFMVILLNLFAFGLLFIGIEHEDNHPYWNIIFTFIASIMFLMLIGFTTTIETSYEMFNATSGNIEKGYHVYYTYQLIFFYFACFIPTFLYFLDLIFHKQLIKLFVRK